jgi:predicted Zn-dependent protease
MTLVFFGILILMPGRGTALSPAERDQYYGSAVAAIQSGRHRDAAMHLYRLLTLDPSERTAYELLVPILLEYREYAPAAVLVVKADRNGIRTPGLWLQQSQALYFLGGFDSAIHPLIKMESLLAETDS